MPTSILEQFSLVAWLLKDLAWCGVCWKLAIPAAVVSTLLEVCLATRDVGPIWPVRVHHIGLIFWLGANCIWMLSELFFEPLLKTERGRRFPWNADGPIVREDLQWYSQGTCMAQIILVCVLFFEIACYAAQHKLLTRIWKNCTSRVKCAENSEALEVYKFLFIVPWIAKDVFWTLDMLVPALVCAMFTASLILHYLWLTRQPIYISMVFWSIGNTAWLCAEVLYSDGRKAPRLYAIYLLLGGLLVSLVDLGRMFGHARFGKDLHREPCAETSPFFKHVAAFKPSLAESIPS